MTSIDLRGKYVFEHSPDEMLVNEIINKLIELGWKHEDSKFNISNISYKNPIHFNKNVKLAQPIEISRRGQNTFQNEGKIELFITGESIDAKTSELSLDIELIPWFHLDVNEVDNFILIASQLWNVISKYTRIQICQWLAYTADYPEEIKRTKIGWITIFPPEVVNNIGKSKILNAPAWRIEEIAGNTFMIVISQTPLDSDRFDKIKILKKHIDPKNKLLGGIK